MDLATIIGLVAGFACIILSMYASGGEVFTYLDPASALMTIGGSFFALMMNYSIKEMISHLQDPREGHQSSGFR
jgi:chemotaxis protein MotA